MDHFTKKILEVIEEDMSFRIYKDYWKFIEHSGNDIVVENSNGQIEVKPVEFLSGSVLEVIYLDYTIVNSGNSDGWVITKVPSELNDFKVKRYECNLGNFTNLEDAKEYCVRFFMIERPETFAKTTCSKMVSGHGTYHDYFLLEDCLLKEGLEIPFEVKPSKDTNYHVTFNGKEI